MKQLRLHSIKNKYSKPKIELSINHLICLYQQSLFKNHNLQNILLNEYNYAHRINTSIL
jgi:hypothetical protein